MASLPLHLPRSFPSSSFRPVAASSNGVIKIRILPEDKFSTEELMGLSIPAIFPCQTNSRLRALYKIPHKFAFFPSGFFFPIFSFRVLMGRFYPYNCSGAPFTEPKPRGPVILEIPLDKIRRPLTRTRTNDPLKVKELMDSIREIGLQEPIDVLDVDGVYYGFSGCHRFEAHQRLGLPTIRCKVRRGTKETLRHHLR